MRYSRMFALAKRNPENGSKANPFQPFSELIVPLTGVDVSASGSILIILAPEVANSSRPYNDPVLGSKANPYKESLTPATGPNKWL